MKIRFRRRPEQQTAPIPEQDLQALGYAKKGIFLAVLSGIIFSGDGLLIEKALGHAPFNDPTLSLLVPLICAGLRDFCAACVITCITWRSGKLNELGRSLASKPGRFILAGAVMGALFGMGGYIAALRLAGPAYVLPITSLYPAVAAILAAFTLKENIPPRSWMGLALCVGGAVLVGYTPPDGRTGEMFYLGLAFASLAAVAWGVEGVCAASGMDFIEPIVALNMYFILSAALYVGLIVPAVSLLFFTQAGGLLVPLSFLASKGALFVATAGCLGVSSYYCWYNAMNMTGVSRAVALNISYALWGIILSAMFSKVHITVGLMAGALVIFTGMCLVIGNPRDMLNLRNVDKGGSHG